MTDRSLRPAPFLTGLGLVTGASLALEVLFTRLLSVLTWYSLAFLVIAMGLFGLTAGAVRVYLAPDEYAPARLPSSLSRDARALAWSIPLSYVLLLIVPLRVEPVLTTLPLFVFFSAVIALPFYPVGKLVAAALTRAPLPVGRVYAVDLVGAAIGAPLVPLLIRLGGAAAILSLSVLAALASVCFAWAGRDGGSVRRGIKLGAGMLALTVVGGSSSGLAPLWVKGQAEDRSNLELELWNSHSRVQVMKPVIAPADFWGKGARCGAPPVAQRTIVIDGHAATPLYLAPLEQLGFLSCDVTNLVHALRPKGPMAVIGVGGSRDIQAALLAGHSPVVGLEFNDRLLEILEGPLGAPTGIAQRRDVRLIHDEARSWLARSPERFQVIQASLIDTWAATGAGAHALGENGLYTLDAWRLFLDRLEPGGIFTVSRWSTVETARLAALAVASLIDRGVRDPSRHIVIAAGDKVTTLLLARDPLTEADLAQLTRAAQTLGFNVIASPGRAPTAARLAALLHASSRAELERETLLPLLDFRPPTDDRPFFFNVIRLGALWHELPGVTRGTIEGNLLATRTLGLAVLASLILVAIAIIVPLRRRARPERRTGRGLGAALAYFSLIGVGFMLAEIALLQRMSVVLGEPSYSLMVVLSSLVGGAGIGSLLSDRLPLDRAPFCYLYPVALASMLALLALLWGDLAPVVEAAPTGTRLAFAAAVDGVVGLGLGVAFPAGMRLVRAHHDPETPWLWGVNGVGSVLASSAAVLIALVGGLTVLLLVAAGAYLLLVPAIAGIRRGGAGDGAPREPGRDDNGK
ncbi:MAG: hypothetical protein OZ921_12270 [Sorangiineae bacterium]|nr:hypothetical protein [Polyangiaceae bacterium]MEB2323281.1 hypothetical protein [Sorangiineae bacterium]